MLLRNSQLRWGMLVRNSSGRGPMVVRNDNSRRRDSRGGARAFAASISTLAQTSEPSLEHRSPRPPRDDQGSCSTGGRPLLKGHQMAPWPPLELGTHGLTVRGGTSPTPPEDGRNPHPP